MTNPYTEHATMTTKYDNEVEKNKSLTMQRNVLGYAWLFMFGAWLIMFAIGFRSDRFFYSECVSYPKLPIIKPTQTK